MCKAIYSSEAAAAMNPGDFFISRGDEEARRLSMSMIVEQEDEDDDGWIFRMIKFGK